jgi:hypothetical protein
VLDVQSSPVKHHVTVTATKRIRLLFAISLAFIMFLLSYFIPLRNDSLEEEALTPPQRIVGEQVKPYIESQFQQARWYSLIESIETHDDESTINTFIFPDQEGRRLADEIVNDLRHQGITGDITIYGKNISHALLIHSQ